MREHRNSPLSFVHCFLAASLLLHRHGCASTETKTTWKMRKHFRSFSACCMCLGTLTSGSRSEKKTFMDDIFDFRIPFTAARSLCLHRLYSWKAVDTANGSESSRNDEFRTYGNCFTRMSSTFCRRRLVAPTKLISFAIISKRVPDSVSRSEGMERWSVEVWKTNLQIENDWDKWKSTFLPAAAAAVLIVKTLRIWIDFFSHIHEKMVKNVCWRTGHDVSGCDESSPCDCRKHLE